MVPLPIIIITSFVIGWLVSFSAIVLGAIYSSDYSLYPALLDISMGDWVANGLLSALGGLLGVLICVAILD